MAGRSARHVVDESAAESENGGGLGEGEIRSSRGTCCERWRIYTTGKIHRDVKANLLLTATQTGGFRVSDDDAHVSAKKDVHGNAVLDGARGDSGRKDTMKRRIFGVWESRVT